MSEAYEHWKKKDSPLWLLLLSRAEAGNQDPGKIDFKEINQYVDHFSSNNLPPLDEENFLKELHWRHHKFFEILKKEAAAYHSAFRDPHLIHQDIYSAELVDQVGKAFGEDKVEEFRDVPINEKTAGNMMVAIAIAAIRDMSLIEYLHEHKKLTDDERKYALNEVHVRLSRVGMNGVDLLFEAKPEMERHVENDTTIMNVRHLANHAAHDTMTRAAYYNAEKTFQLGLPVPILTTPRQHAIAKGFDELEGSKDQYILVHTYDVPPLSSEVRKKFEGYGLIRGRNEAKDLKHVNLLTQIQAEMNSAPESRNNYVNFLLHDGIAINHPQRDRFVESLKQRMHKSDIIEAEIIDPKRAPELPQNTDKDKKSDSPKKSFGSHTERLTSQSNYTGYGSSYADKKKEGGGLNGPAGHDNDSNTGAAIATIGGAAAVGLLLASGKNKSGEDNKKTKSSALKFAALAGASAVAVGGLIMWSKKPELLYKTMNDVYKNLGSGRA